MANKSNGRRENDCDQGARCSEQGKIGHVKWVIPASDIEGKKFQTPNIQNVP